MVKKEYIKLNNWFVFLFTLILFFYFFFKLILTHNKIIECLSIFSVYLKLYATRGFLWYLWCGRHYIYVMILLSWIYDGMFSQLKQNFPFFGFPEKTCTLKIYQVVCSKILECYLSDWFVGKQNIKCNLFTTIIYYWHQ